MWPAKAVGLGTVALRKLANWGCGCDGIRNVGVAPIANLGMPPPGLFLADFGKRLFAGKLGRLNSTDRMRIAEN